MKSPALVVPKEQGEEARKDLIRMGLLRRDLRIETGDDTLLLPVREEVSMGFPIAIHDFREAPRRPRGYRDLVKVPEEFQDLLPRSYDIIGDVIILKIAEELAGFDTAIGTALLGAHKGVRTVAVDEGIVGQQRRRSMRVIAGRGSTRTVHREYGLAIAVDPAEVYFSPRMAGERRRVALQVPRGEVVVDAFCGVGPFALHVALRGAKVVYAVDTNPRAVEFLRENIRMNRVEDVVPLQRDVNEALPELGPADRIILDFPQKPLPYFPLAASALKDGGILHYYEILEKALLDGRVADLERVLPHDLSLEVLEIREVRGYSPSQGHYAFDLRILRG